jgi:hypothetical protein
MESRALQSSGRDAGSKVGRKDAVERAMARAARPMPTDDVSRAIGQPYSGFHQLWRWLRQALKK